MLVFKFVPNGGGCGMGHVLVVFWIVHQAEEGLCEGFGVAFGDEESVMLVGDGFGNAAVLGG